MPKLWEMAQISRPFQIALVTVCLLAGIWLFALQGRSTSTSGSGSATVATSPTPTPAATHHASAAAPKSSAAGAPSHVYHGPVPGLEGLTRDISRAHKAAGAPQQVGERIEKKSAEVAGEAAPSQASAGGTPVTQAGSSTGSPAHSPAATAATPATGSAATHPVKAQTGAGKAPARQVLVEHALHEGKVAVILFWNPKGTEDVIVNEQLKLLEAVHHLIRPVAHVPQVRHALERSGLELQAPFAAFEAPASQVASFGSITRDVQVSATPTIFVINKKGQTIVLSGLQDAYSIEQAIDEARKL